MSNSINEEVEGKYVIISKKALKPKFRDAIKRVFFCTGGFGCSPKTSGSAIFGKFVFDGEECRMSGYNLERFATEEEIKKAKEMGLI